MVLPLGTFPPRVDGCNTPGRTHHLLLVDDPGGTAQDDEDKDDHKDDDKGEDKVGDKDEEKDEEKDDDKNEDNDGDVGF